MAWFSFKNKSNTNSPKFLNEDREFSPGVTSNYIGTIGYDGEKTPGEIGNIKNYIPEFRRLRLRAWQSFFESEITQTVTNKFVMWAIGAGLKLQSEPVLSVLESNNVILPKSFSTDVEKKFALFAKDEKSDYANLSNLNNKAAECKKNALVSGDCLVVLRTDSSGNVNVQLVDGEHLVTPFFGSSDLLSITKRGHSISHGIEKSSKGKHIAYWVLDRKGKINRLSARDRRGMKRVYLVYGSKYRLDHDRGMPLVTVILETLKKLERYKEAVVSSAEERAKLVYAFEHDKDAIGANPLQSHIVNTVAGNKVKPPDDSYTVIEGQKESISLTTQKQVINVTPGGKIKSLDSDNDLKFEPFYRANVDMVCAAVGIPPEVALSKYDSNFSASRAALKDWENTLNVDREEYSRQFYKPIYDLWLSLQIRMGKIDIPNINLSNDETVNALFNARWRGAAVPHIDPLKEVRAEREKLGATGANIPLTTAERAIETLGGGDFRTIAKQYIEDLELSPNGEKTE